MQEIRVRIDDAGTHEKGELLQIVKKGEAKIAWDQTLANGRCTQAQYDSAKVGIDFMWPFKPTEKRKFAIICIDDVISNVDCDKFSNGTGGIRSDYKIDFDDPALGVSGQTKADILNPSVSVEIRYDKLKPRTIINIKP